MMKTFTVEEMHNSELWQVIAEDHEQEIIDDGELAMHILGLNWHMIMNGCMAYDRLNKKFITLWQPSTEQA